MINELLNISEIPGLENIEETRLEKFDLVEITSSLVDRQKDIEKDYEKVRRNMDFQQQMLLEASKIALENARNGEHPKQMEVFSTLMNQLTLLNTKIISVHKDVSDISKVNGGNSEEKESNNISANNVYIGTNAELMALVGSQQDQIEKIKNEKVVESNNNE